MTAQVWMSKATMLASKIYKHFLTEIIEAHLMKNDRELLPLSVKAKKQIAKGTHIDPRPLRLMTISGKGGYTANPDLQSKYNKYYNITLLEHLLSVVRGSLLLASLDWLSRNPDMDTSLIERRLAMVALIAFLHDIDKDLGLARNEAIPLEGLEERITRYGIPFFLKPFGLILSSEQLRYLIEKVEATQAHRHHPEILPPRELENLARYVRLADQLDGIWVSSDPEKGGLKGVIDCLKNDQGALRSDLCKNWKAIQLFDPLHPFLLDELQRYLSRFSLHLAGVPPLIEVHQDGHFFMLLPSEQYDAIVDKGLSALCNGLPFNLYLDISNRGLPSLYNGQPNYDELEAFIKELDTKQKSGLLKIKTDLKDSLNDVLDNLLSDIGLEPRWPKPTGQLLTLYASFNDFDQEAIDWAHYALLLALLLNLNVKSKPKDKVLTPTQRELALLEIVDISPPSWLSSIKEDTSRRTLTSLWVTAIAAENDELIDSIWEGEYSLLRQWLEGTKELAGFNSFILGDGVEIIRTTRQRIVQLLSSKRVQLTSENEKGRCIFTDEPVPFANTIKQATGLYGVKISAFSGREGRPESVVMTQAHTNVGAASLAEHKLRAQSHTIQGGRDNGVPTLISSPSTQGLFGGLALADDKMMGAVSLYDLSRLQVSKGRVMSGMEIHSRRYRIARLERIPEKLADQVQIMRMLLTACRRTGRPFHLFRGLPQQRKEFFYYDAMPQVLIQLLGGRSLFLEQIPNALNKLQIINDLLETTGIGHDVLKLYANPKTRFKAACLSWCHLKDLEDDNKDKKVKLMEELKDIYMNVLEGDKKMNEDDGALVKLGTAAAGIQQNPGGRSSTSDQLLVFKLCLEAVTIAQKQHQTDTASLIYAVAGELESNLVRREKAAKKANRNGKTLMEGCESVAAIFVNEVWPSAFGNKFPSQKSRRVLSSIYRIAFLKAHKDITERQQQESNK
ncbi:HD domain-containing protein [Desulfocicer niacini]